MVGAWLMPLVGLAAMYLPVYWAAAHSVWQTDDHAHGPLVLLVVLWLLWGQRRNLAPVRPEGSTVAGPTLFAGGIAMFLFGRMLDSSLLTFGSQPLVVAGLLMSLKGRRALALAWFPVIYLVFMVPLPSVLVDAATGGLKQWISVIAESLLHAAGYPVARTGVVITIGQYQMLVADACSGLNSMFSLAALGTLYMYLMRRPGRLRNAIMLLAILPIAFGANVVRVIILMLITYHFGDAAGQSFLHGLAGIVLMLTALLIFFALDSLLRAVSRRRTQAVRSTQL